MGMITPLRKTVTYLSAPLGMHTIRSQWQTVSELASVLSSPPHSEVLVLTGVDYRIDYAASSAKQREIAAAALEAGQQPAHAYQMLSTITPVEFETLLRVQAPPKPYRAWIWLSACAASTLFWLAQALLHPLEYTSMLYVLGWSVSTLFLGAMAVKELWMNWNRRTGRNAPLMAFLRTDESWFADV